MVDDDAVESFVPADLSAEKAREAKQLDAVTDFVEDKEVDTKKAQEAIHSLAASSDGSALSAADAELAKIKVKDEDVAFLVRELECTEDEASRRLRRHANSVSAALRAAIRVEHC